MTAAETAYLLAGIAVGVTVTLIVGQAHAVRRVKVERTRAAARRAFGSIPRGLYDDAPAGADFGFDVGGVRALRREP